MEVPGWPPKTCPRPFSNVAPRRDRCPLTRGNSNPSGFIARVRKHPSQPSRRRSRKAQGRVCGAQHPGGSSSFRAELVERSKWKVEEEFQLFYLPPFTCPVLLALGQLIFSLRLLVHTGRSPDKSPDAGRGGYGAGAVQLTKICKFCEKGPGFITRVRKHPSQPSRRRSRKAQGRVCGAQHPGGSSGFRAELVERDKWKVEEDFQFFHLPPSTCPPLLALG